MKNKIEIYIVLIATVCLFCSCITNKQKTYFQKITPVYPRVSFEEYRLCVNDEITYYLMTASEEAEQLYNFSQRGGMAGTNGIPFRIYDDGCVVFPTIGRVKIVGLTIREAERVITKVFQTSVYDAEVRVALINNYYYVLGDGGKGQQYVYKENMNIYQALALTGDISSAADKSRVKIIRKGIDGMDKIHTFDLRKHSIIESEFYYIKPNDVIYISTNFNSFFMVDSLSSFISLFITPISLLILVLSLFQK